MWAKLKIIKQHKLLLKDETENNKILTKETRKKNHESKFLLTKLEKITYDNCNLRTKLKTSKTFLKEPRTKISNKKHKKNKLKNKKKRGNMCTFYGREKRRKEIQKK